MTTRYLRPGHVSGYVFIIRTQSGREFPYVPSFGMTVEDAVERMRASIRRSGAKSRQPIALAMCDLNVNAVKRLIHGSEWEQLTTESIGA